MKQYRKEKKLTAIIQKYIADIYLSAEHSVFSCTIFDKR